MRTVSLSSGAEARVHNEGAPLAGIVVNGGTAKPVPGTWSATGELLARELALRCPRVSFVEVRYRLKSWHALSSCMDDAVSALDLAESLGARAASLIGFSMGGAVSIGVAGDERVAGVLGLAPWIPDRLSVEGLSGKRFDVIHGAWDRHLPGVPGVSPISSRVGFERARAAGAHGSYTVIPRGLHGCAVRAPSGGLLRLPRWREWVELTMAVLGRHQSSVVGSANAAGPSASSD
jgi:pimeloyl-ACP methyl ester carboxylesterase